MPISPLGCSLYPHVYINSMHCVLQSRPLRLYYSVYDGPEVPLPEDDFTERFYRSRDLAQRDHKSTISRYGLLPFPPDVKPIVNVDVKPPPLLEDFSTNYFRSGNQTGSDRKRRRRSSDADITTEKRIKREVTADSHLYGRACSRGHATMTSPVTSPRLSSGGPLSLPVTISKDFIKELAVSRGLQKDVVDSRGCAEDATGAAAAAAAAAADDDDVDVDDDSRSSSVHS